MYPEQIRNTWISFSATCLECFFSFLSLKQCTSLWHYASIVCCLFIFSLVLSGNCYNNFVFLLTEGGAFQPLSWSLRMKIAIGAARGLAFLHSAEKHVIYRDFKASNILLDSVNSPSSKRYLCYVELYQLFWSSNGVMWKL